MTVSFWVFCAAAAYVPLPAWLASITQLPAALKDTVAGEVDEPPEIEHTPLEADATVNVTARPDDELADTEPLPPTNGPDGAATTLPSTHRQPAPSSQEPSCDPARPIRTR